MGKYKNYRMYSKIVITILFGYRSTGFGYWQGKTASRLKKSEKKKEIERNSSSWNWGYSPLGVFFQATASGGGN